MSVAISLCTAQRNWGNIILAFENDYLIEQINHSHLIDKQMQSGTHLSCFTIVWRNPYCETVVANHGPQDISRLLLFFVFVLAES